MMRWWMRALMTGAVCGLAGAGHGGEAFTLVAFGDSLTAGAPGFRSPLEAPPRGSGNPESQYTYWIQQQHPQWQIFNRGRSGLRSDELLRRFAEDALGPGPHVLIILAGTNDVYQGYPVSWTVEHLQRMYELAKQAGARVIACSLPPFAGMDAAQKQRMTEINAWIRRYSQQHGMKFCDLFLIAQHREHPWQLASSDDGLHPDAALYHRFGDALMDVLDQ
jgi:lysophospholipase L1-like esterase